MFSRSVRSFVETFEENFQGGEVGGGADGKGEALLKDKFVKGFKKLSEGFSMFQQVRRYGGTGRKGDMTF